jgi:hypothetical protein
MGTATVDVPRRRGVAILPCGHVPRIRAAGTSAGRVAAAFRRSLSARAPAAAAGGRVRATPGDEMQSAERATPASWGRTTAATRADAHRATHPQAFTGDPAMSRPSLVLALALAAAAPLGAQTTRGVARAARPSADSSGSMAADLEMMGEERPFGAFANEFLAAAAAGDSTRAAAMISPKLRAQAGAAGVAQVLRTKGLPVVGVHPQPAGASTVTRTTTAFGDQGFAYYRYAARRGGAEPLPFVLYVVREGGRLVVANVVVDHHVEGRHR